jgi:hypothetical protein
MSKLYAKNMDDLKDKCSKLKITLISGHDDINIQCADIRWSGTLLQFWRINPHLDMYRIDRFAHEIAEGNDVLYGHEDKVTLKPA